MEVAARLVTNPEACSYLHDQKARTDLRLVAAIEPDEYADALRSGHRRFGMMVFRPACDACRACIPLRVLVERFQPSKSQRRVLRKNADVRIELGYPAVDAERLALHQAFHAERTARVGWKAETIDADGYRRTFIENVVPTLELRYRVEGRLAAVAYVDRSPEALNSIYCFYHPDFAGRSLGTFDVLTEIEIARRLGLGHLYLGYLVEGCRSMAYKGRFRPAEVLVDGQWRELGIESARDSE